jgi:tRNA nucleotidyltransferase (CCA-adding enzyme)
LQSSFCDLQDEVLRRVRPTSEERERLRKAANEILACIEELARCKGVICQPILVGSAARSTWLAGDHDLDIFLAVPEDTDLNKALELARLAAPAHVEKYAEHAYVHANINGFETDLVPCYLLENASKIKSAVDRTPFHTRYVSSRIKGLEDEVLLLKQFMKGVAVYGSELKLGGFSGYLSELLVLHYGSFLSVLKGALSWRPGEIIDLEAHAARSHQDPLVVVDPVDPERNVAAALTLDRMFQFCAAARCFLESPESDFFMPSEKEPITDQELVSKIKARGTAFLLLDFEAPPMVEDVIFPQLRKAEEAIHALFQRNGFTVFRSDVDCHFVGGTSRARVLFELEAEKLPSIIKRQGPPIWEAEHLSRFLSSHPKPLSGPYIQEGRAFVEELRKYAGAKDLLTNEIRSLSLGKHLNKEVQREHNIYAGLELAQIKDHGFRTFMARYLEARFRMC